MVGRGQGWGALVESARNPRRELRHAWAGEAGKRRVGGSKDRVRQAALRTFGRRANDLRTSGIQRGGRGGLGPRRRVPRFAFGEIKQQPADRNALAADKRACSLPHVEGRDARGNDQGGRAVADRRLADADEIVTDAQIETALENRGDLATLAAPAKIAGNDAGAQHGDRANIDRVRQAHCAAAPRSRACALPTVASASAAASALESATITSAASSLRTCSARGCGSPSVPVTEATMRTPSRRP